MSIRHEAFHAVVLRSIGDLGRDAWQSLAPRSAEGWDYLLACEAAPPPTFAMGAIGCFTGPRLVAAVTFCSTRYDLLLALNAPRLSDRLGNYVARPRLLCMGSPLTEYCPLMFAPDLDLAQRKQAFAAILEAFMAHARKEGISLVAVKDLPEPTAGAFDHNLLAARFNRLVGLPVATLTVTAHSFENYLAGCTVDFRRKFKRGLRKAENLTVEHVDSVEHIAPTLFELFEATRQRAGVSSGDFDRIAPDFLSAVCRAKKGARVSVYRLVDEIVGFNLVLAQHGKTVAKYVGMKHPVATTHELYRFCVKDIIETAIKSGHPEISFGPLNYRFKVRSGCRLERNFVYFRHMNRPVNAALALTAKHFHYDTMDPDLAELATLKRYTFDHRDPLKPLNEIAPMSSA